MPADDADDIIRILAASKNPPLGAPVASWEYQRRSNQENQGKPVVSEAGCCAVLKAIPRDVKRLRIRQRFIGIGGKLSARTYKAHVFLFLAE